MNAVPIKAAAVAVAVLAASAFGAHAESGMVRNCTWCHGGSAQGYSPAPRLAGQRPTYIEQQLVSFAHHTRDTPFSKQYMWGAAGNLSPRVAHALSVYFSNLPARAADDGNRELVAWGEAIYGCRKKILRPVSLAMAQMPKVLARFLGSGGLITLTSNVGSNNGLKAIMGPWYTLCRTLPPSCHEIRLENWLEAGKPSTVWRCCRRPVSGHFLTRFGSNPFERCQDQPPRVSPLAVGSRPRSWRSLVRPASPA
jgi:cytochrome c553